MACNTLKANTCPTFDKESKSANGSIVAICSLVNAGPASDKFEEGGLGGGN